MWVHQRLSFYIPVHLWPPLLTRPLHQCFSNFSTCRPSIVQYNTQSPPPQLYRYIKGVIWCDFKCSFSLECYKLCIDKIPEVAKTKVSNPKRYSLSKLRLVLLKRLIQTRPTCLHHGVGRFAKHRPNVYAMKEGGAIILSVVLLLPPASCSGDAVFRCERENTLFGIQKRTQLEISG